MVGFVDDEDGARLTHRFGLFNRGSCYWWPSRPPGQPFERGWSPTSGLFLIALSIRLSIQPDRSRAVNRTRIAARVIRSWQAHEIRHSMSLPDEHRAHTGSEPLRQVAGLVTRPIPN